MHDKDAQLRHLLHASTCASDVDHAANSWARFVNVCGGEDIALEWLSTGPPRRVMPFLGSRSEVLGLTERMTAACQEATDEAWALNQQVLDDATAVFSHLLDNDIEVIALKGLALAGEVYSPHWLRAIGDIDLLVRPGEHRRATKVFEKAGWRRTRSTYQSRRRCHEREA